MDWSRQNFCGCCGWPCIGEWCDRCRPHLRPRNYIAYERTFFAQHGRPCPFDVSNPDVEEPAATKARP